MTWSVAIASIPTIIGPFIILLFCPLDQREVYKMNNKLYEPNGTLYKAATERNFTIRKSEHTPNGYPIGMSSPSGGDDEGEWGTTTYVGSMTWSFAIISIISFGIGWIIVLLFCPLDTEEVYKGSDGVLYLPNGERFKAASEHNFFKRNSKHVKVSNNKELILC